MQQISLAAINIDVVHKDIKNMHLSVYPPSGRVRISAPLHMDIDTIRVFAITKVGWIKQQQAKLLAQEREAPRDYITQESHYYLGKRYLLRVIEHEGPSKVILKHSTIEMLIRSGTAPEKRMEILDAWYRKQLKAIIPAYIQHWESVMKVRVGEIAIKKMKTKWGSCNREAGRVWLNLELGKKPLHCIEYIIVHEMVHLLERKHNERFIAYMDGFLPKWRFYKEELNRSPLRHENWSY